MGCHCVYLHLRGSSFTLAHRASSALTRTRHSSHSPGTASCGSTAPRSSPRASRSWPSASSRLASGSSSSPSRVRPRTCSLRSREAFSSSSPLVLLLWACWCGGWCRRQRGGVWRGWMRFLGRRMGLLIGWGWS